MPCLVPCLVVFIWLINEKVNGRINKRLCALRRCAEAQQNSRLPRTDGSKTRTVSKQVGASFDTEKGTACQKRASHCGARAVKRHKEGNAPSPVGQKGYIMALSCSTTVIYAKTLIYKTSYTK